MNLAIADQAERVAALPVDGVGLLRAEFMITDALGGVHPRALLARGGREEFLDRMAASLLRIDDRVRAATGRVPNDRLPHQRVPQARGRRRVRAGRGEPDDRLPRLLPLRARAGPVHARVRAARARPRADTEPARHDPVRAHAVGARGVPRADRREPARAPARAAPLGDGRGAVGRLPHPGVRGARASTACRSDPTTSRS